MALPAAFLDAVRDRTVLSGLIGRTVKLTKAGREFKGCCPFHNEKSPSFTVNDDKGFYHCFGCGAHGDVFRWLGDHEGLPFIDAVKELALAAGLDMPEPSPQAAEQARRIDTVRGALDVAQAIYARQLASTGAVMEYLAGRGVGPVEVERFGIGFARGGDGSLRGQGIGSALGLEAGLLAQRTDDRGLREMFWDRITVPIHDARGALCGFAGRVWPGRSSDKPKFVNPPDGPLFDKGRLLFNLHRAAPLARQQAENRLIVVEGYFDVVALDRAGFGAVVAPMGTALTPDQLQRAWRVHHRPVLLLDGDRAGQAAALRACKTALPLVGPGRELAVALLPDGKDPDDVLREADGARVIEAALLEAQPLHAFVFDGVVGTILVGSHQARRHGAEGDISPGVSSADRWTPECLSAVWAELAELARTIADEEVRAQYLGVWRARFERDVSAAADAAPEPGTALHALTWDENGEYAFPDSENDSAARLIAIVRAVLKKRDERRQITEEIGDLMKMAEAIGFVKKEVTAVVRDIESDLAHGPARREEAEMVRVLYRRTLGIRGPLDEAMLPRVADARQRPVAAQVKRRAAMNALIDARAIEV